MNEENRIPAESNVQAPINEEHPIEEKNNKESVGLKVGLGVAAVAATGAVAARSMRNNSETPVSNESVVESVPNVNPNDNLPGETYSNETVDNSHGNTNSSNVTETNPSDVYVHTVDENGNESVTHYHDYNNDGEMDHYEVYDSEGNLVDQGDVISTSSESDGNGPGYDESDISFYPEEEVYNENEGSLENDPDVMVDHENQPDQGEYQGIDWDAVENGSMDEVAVNDATGADGDDVLASNDQYPGYDNNGMGFNQDVASNEFVVDENETNSIENVDFDDSHDARSDDYALNEEDYSSDDYNSDDYSSDDYNSDDYSSDDYSTDDYSSDDYSSDDYSSGLEDFSC
ncbi:MAG: hypothetical protein ACKO4Y_01385 [Flavobacteriales bacterium]